MTVTKRLKVLSAILLILIGIWWDTRTAETVGIGAAPAELELSLEAGKSKVERLVIQNPSSAVSLFDIYPDEFPDIIRVIPSSFVLESGKEREVTVRVNPKKAGIIQTALSIVSKPLSENEFGANAGVKVPIVVTSRKAPPLGAALVDAVKDSKAAMAGTMIILLALGFLLLIKSIKLLKQYG